MESWGKPLSDDEFERMHEKAKHMSPPRAPTEVFQYDRVAFPLKSTKCDKENPAPEKKHVIVHNYECHQGSIKMWTPSDPEFITRSEHPWEPQMPDLRDLEQSLTRVRQEKLSEAEDEQTINKTKE
jgi:hypothetical protein